MKLVRKSVLALMLLGPALSGCAWHDARGVRHTLVLGIGYFSTTNSSVSVSDLRALGFVHSARGTALGYTRQHVVEIDPQAAGDAVVSIRSTPFSLKVHNFDCSLTNVPVALHSL